MATLFVIAAPSGAGKTSLVRAVTESMEDIQVSVSHTTRPKRPGEEDKVNYHFVSVEEFESFQKDDAFLECAKVFGHDYGTSRAAVEQALESGTDVILEIDWQGAEQVRENYKDSVSIFILPPSQQALYDRLVHRNQDEKEVISNRMGKAIAEMSHYYEFDYIVINDNFDLAVENIKGIIMAHRLTQEEQAKRYPELILELLKT